MPPAEHATRLAARLDGAVAMDLEVAATGDVAPGIREVRLHGELQGFDPWPGQDLMVSVPPRDANARWRRYTVRRLEHEAGTVDLWVTTTTDGPGAAWAASATVGDRVDAVGPRGKIALRDDATAHLFAVDESGLAACAAMAEALEPPASVLTFALLVTDPQWLPTGEIGPQVRDGVTLVPHVLDPTDLDWVTRVLETVVARVDPATTAAYVFGELALTRRVAADLAALGLDPARTAVKPYWRDGRANEANGEPDRDDA